MCEGYPKTFDGVCYGIHTGAIGAKSQGSAGGWSPASCSVGKYALCWWRCVKAEPGSEVVPLWLCYCTRLRLWCLGCCLCWDYHGNIRYGVWFLVCRWFNVGCPWEQLRAANDTFGSSSVNGCNFTVATGKYCVTVAAYVVAHTCRDLALEAVKVEPSYAEWFAVGFAGVGMRLSASARSTQCAVRMARCDFGTACTLDSWTRCGVGGCGVQLRCGDISIGVSKCGLANLRRFSLGLLRGHCCTALAVHAFPHFLALLCA